MLLTSTSARAGGPQASANSASIPAAIAKGQGVWNCLFCILFMTGIGERELWSINVGVALNRIGALPPSRPQQRG